MRTSDHILPVALLSISLGLGLTTAHALDLKTPSNSPPVLPGVGPVGAAPAVRAPASAGADNLDAFFQKMEMGDTEGAVKELENAFRNGNIRAGWKLARMYADGEKVPQDRFRAFEIFHAIVESQHGAVPAGKSKSFVADALVTMGRDYLTGIPNSAIKAEPVRAFDQFYQAALNYASADGQYHLARAYLDGQGTARNPALAVKWLFEAANKENFEAQAELGRLLVKGFGPAMPQDIPRGLAWLKIAVETAPKGTYWIQALYDSAWKQATEDERSAAMVYVEKWRARGPRP
jgi:exopolysaccharide production negative regulator